MQSPAVPDADTAARTFLRIFAVVVLTMIGLVAVFNRFVQAEIERPENQTIVQLIGGWSRVYKPILMDRFNPEGAVYGASWARDAFDPIALSSITGQHWYNHAVSAATPYEMRRFVESSLDDPNLRQVIINLDTFLIPQAEVRRKQGFDESLLDQDADGRPTRWLGARRWFATTLSGAAVGNNIEVLAAIRARDRGADPAEYLDSYDRFDFAGHEADIEKLRQVLAEPASVPGIPVDEALPVPPGKQELERALDLLCARGVSVIGYFTPTMVLLGATERGLAAQLHGLELFRRRQADCGGTLHFYNFNYVNALTLDGLEQAGRYSGYFRTDGHPRPTIGELMAARMFGRPFPPGTPPAIAADFGDDLLLREDAEQRLLEQARQMARFHAAVSLP